MAIEGWVGVGFLVVGAIVYALDRVQKHRQRRVLRQRDLNRRLYEIERSRTY